MVTQEGILTTAKGEITVTATFSGGVFEGTGTVGVALDGCHSVRNDDMVRKTEGEPSICHAGEAGMDDHRARNRIELFEVHPP